METLGTVEWVVYAIPVVLVLAALWMLFRGVQLSRRCDALMKQERLAYIRVLRHITRDKETLH